MESTIILITPIVLLLQNDVNTLKCYEEEIKQDELSNKEKISKTKIKKLKQTKIPEVLKVPIAIGVSVRFLLELLSDLINILKNLSLILVEKSKDYKLVDTFFTFLLDLPEIKELIVRVANFHIEQNMGSGLKAQATSFSMGFFIRRSIASDIFSYTSPEHLIKSNLMNFELPTFTLSQIFNFVIYFKNVLKRSVLQPNLIKTINLI